MVKYSIRWLAGMLKFHAASVAMKCLLKNKEPSRDWSLRDGVAFFAFELNLLDDCKELIFRCVRRDPFTIFNY